MPKISGLATLTGPSLLAGDLVTVVDGSDPTMSATTGTNKQMTASEFSAGIQALNPGWALLTGRPGGQVFPGGTGQADNLTLKSSSHVAPTGDIIFLGGAAGATELGRMLNAGTFTWNGQIVATNGLRIPSTLYGVSAVGDVTANNLVASNGASITGAKLKIGTSTLSYNISGFGGIESDNSGSGSIYSQNSALGISFLGTEVHDNQNLGCNIDMRTSRGTIGAPMHSLTGDSLGAVHIGGGASDTVGQTPGGYVDCAHLRVVAVEDFGVFAPGASGCKWEFYTTPLNTGAKALAMTIGHDGLVTAPTGFAINGFFGINASGAGSFTSVILGGPTITSGAGAPATTPPNGSVYFRTDGTASTTVYVRAAGAWTAITVP